MDKTEYPYTGLWGCESVCDLTVWEGDGRAVVVFHERPDNPGTSVTNLSEILATQVKWEQLGEYDPEKIRWFEHYEGDNVLPDRWDEITYTMENGRYYAPHWQPATHEAVEALMKGSEWQQQHVN